MQRAAYRWIGIFISTLIVGAVVGLIIYLRSTIPESGVQKDNENESINVTGISSPDSNDAIKEPLTRVYTAVRYSIAYPETWTPANVSGREVFTNSSGAKIELYERPGASGADAKARALAVLTAIENEWSAMVSDFTIYHREPFDYVSPSTVIFKAHLFLATYRQDGVLYRHWQVAIPDASGQRAVAYAFIAPDSQYETYIKTARAMLRTLKIE